MNELHITKIQAAAASLYERGDIDSIDDFFSPHYCVHLTEQVLNGGNKIIGIAIKQIKKAFPELTLEVEILMVCEDRVAWQRTLKGQQKGAFKGFPASNREIVWREIVVSRFENGLITEEWVSTDLAEQLLASRKKS